MRALRLRKDGLTLLSGGADGCVMLWDASGRAGTLHSRYFAFKTPVDDSRVTKLTPPGSDNPTEREQNRRPDDQALASEVRRDGPRRGARHPRVGLHARDGRVRGWDEHVRHLGGERAARGDHEGAQRGGAVQLVRILNASNPAYYTPLSRSFTPCSYRTS